MIAELQRVLDEGDKRVSSLDKISAALKAGDCRAAITACVRLLENDVTSVRALLFLATAAQLAAESDVGDITLDDISEILRRAARYQEMADDAEHEYARFLFAVADDSPRAHDVLEQALARRSEQLEKLFIAEIEVLIDLGRTEEMKKLLTKALSFYPDSADLLDLQRTHLSGAAS